MARLLVLAALLAAGLAACGDDSTDAPAPRQAPQELRKPNSGGAAAETTGAASAPGGRSRCAPGLAVGPSTSCAFAENVRGEYGSAGRGGDATISVFSPTTGRSYEMDCKAGATTVCRGGNDAVVYIRG